MILQVKNGILNIDKPQGITSHDVVDVIRKLFPKTKIGHTGTLDPIATGVLPICIGSATKLSESLTSENKVYKVKMLLGVETDTYDITGKIVFASVVPKDDIYIKERIKRFIGKQMQLPPLYSAIRVDGKRLYEYARNGMQVDVDPRKIEIFDISDIKVDLSKNEVSMVVSCTKGTYIRSLVNDIGKKIGCGAVMSELERLQTGDFKIEDSIKLYDFLELPYEEMLKKVIPIEEYFSDRKKINFRDDEYNKFLNGIMFDIEPTSEEIVRIYLNNKYKGLGKVENNKLKRFIIE